jgi:hypothetical protein
MPLIPNVGAGLPPTATSEPGANGTGVADAFARYAFQPGVIPGGGSGGLGGNTFAMTFQPGAASEREPPLGNVTLNAVNIAEATILYSSDKQPNGSDIKGFYGFMAVESFLRLTDATNPTNWLFAKITKIDHISKAGPPEENFYRLKITTLASSGVFSVQTNACIVSQIGL